MVKICQIGVSNERQKPILIHQRQNLTVKGFKSLLASAQDDVGFCWTGVLCLMISVHLSTSFAEQICLKISAYDFLFCCQFATRCLRQSKLQCKAIVLRILDVSYASCFRKVIHYWKVDVFYHTLVDFGRRTAQRTEDRTERGI